MINKYVLLCLISVFIASLSQIFLKISADKSYANKIKEYLNTYVITAYMMFLSSTLLTVIALKGISLSKAPVLESAGYIFILLLGRIILKERITPLKVAGNLLIIIGILVYSKMVLLSSQK